jgi:hypothetical protein
MEPIKDQCQVTAAKKDPSPVPVGVAAVAEGAAIRRYAEQADNIVR